MGKKKASHQKFTYALINHAIDNDKIYVRMNNTIQEGDIAEYDILFGNDEACWEHNTSETIMVNIVYNRKRDTIKYQFFYPYVHGLTSAHHEWFRDCLKGIIVCHKMGAYESHKAYSHFTGPQRWMVTHKKRKK